MTLNINFYWNPFKGHYEPNSADQPLPKVYWARMIKEGSLHRCVFVDLTKNSDRPLFRFNVRFRVPGNTE